jgi:hypothetical protein
MYIIFIMDANLLNINYLLDFSTTDDIFSMFLVNNHEKEDLNMFEDQDLKFISSSPFHSTISNREEESLNPSPKNMKEKESFLGRKLSSTTFISEAEVSTMMKKKKVFFQTVNSVDEDSELKKEMKKLKNRSSAKKYRDNQKVYIKQMEAMIEKLNGEISMLRNPKTGNNDNNKNDLESLFDKVIIILFIYLFNF